MSTDEDRRVLERQVKEGNASAVTHLQALNDRVGLSADDADYLLAYLDINERWTRALGDHPSRDDVEAELTVLNEAYRLKVGSKTIKMNLMAKEAFEEGRNDERTWATSRDC